MHAQCVGPRLHQNKVQGFVAHHAHPARFASLMLHLKQLQILFKPECQLHRAPLTLFYVSPSLEFYQELSRKVQAMRGEKEKGCADDSQWAIVLQGL